MLRRQRVATTDGARPSPRDGTNALAPARVAGLALGGGGGGAHHLTASEVEASLAVVQRRSAAASCIVIAYQSPPTDAPVTSAPAVWRNEPLRPFWTTEQMRAPLERAGFHVEGDQDLVACAERCGADLSSAGSLVSTSRVVVGVLRRPG